MAILAVDEVMLREPRLLVPRMQPLGKVKIDWGNPLTNDLLWCLCGTQDYELVSNARYAGANYRLGGHTAKAALIASTALNPRAIRELNCYSIFGAFFVTTYTGGLYFGRVLTDGYGPMLYTASGFSVRIQHGAADFTTRAFNIAGALSGWNTISGAVNCAEDSCEAVKNGIVVSSTAVGTAQTSIPVNAANLIAQPNSTNNVPFICAWGRKLSLAEQMSFHKDPYQFLIPD